MHSRVMRNPAQPHGFFSTRATLLARVAHGDNASWEDFYSRYARLIDWFCRERAVPPMASRDERLLVIQAVMVFFHSSGFRYDASRGSSFRSYLLGVTRNKVHEVRQELRSCSGARGGGAEQESDVPYVECITEQSDPLGEHERQERLIRALERLEADPSVNPLHLRVLGLLLDGASEQEVCKETGLQLNNVYVVKHLLIRRLRELDSQECRP